MKYFIIVLISGLSGVGLTMLVQKHIVFLQELASQFTSVALVGGTRAGMSLNDHAAYVYVALGAAIVLAALKVKGEIQRRWVNYKSKKLIEAAFEQKEGKPNRKLKVVKAA